MGKKRKVRALTREFGGSSTALIKSMIKQLPSPTAVLSYQGDVLLFSDRWEREFKGQAGTPVHQLLPNLSRPWKDIWNDVLSERAIDLQGQKLLARDGKLEWVNVHLSPWKDERGDIVGLLISLEFVTDLETNRKTLEESEKLFRDLSDGSPALIWRADQNGEIVYLNTSFWEYIGKERGGSRNEDFYNAVHPGDRWTLESVFKNVSDPKRESVQYRLRDKHGNYRWYLDTISPSFSPERKIKYFTGASVDTHEKVIAARSIKEQEERLKKLYVAASDGSLSFAELIEQTLANVCEALDLDIGIVSRIKDGEYFIEHVHAPGLSLESNFSFDLDDTYCERTFGQEGVLDTSRASESAWATHPCYQMHQLESYIGMPFSIDGEKYGTVNFSSPRQRKEPFTELDREYFRLVVGWLGAIFERELASNKLKELTKTIARSNKKLARAQREAEAATKAKSSFLANMSHEIRTPLTSIIGFTEALLLSELDPSEEYEALRAVFTNGNHLLQVINDILDFSKLEAGEFAVEKGQCNLKNLFGDVYSSFKQKAKEKGLTLDFQYAFPLPSIIETDPFRLRQILFNLLSNALKFTKEGSVSVEVSCDSSQELLFLDIRDTGIGVPEEKHERLFKAFSQADTSTSREFGGTGLGLVISGQLAKRLGGEVTFESEQGVGSVFRVTIPTGPLKSSDMTESFGSFDDQEHNQPVKSSFRAKGKVLFADDCEHNRDLVSLLLTKIGVDVRVVENGEKAVVLCKEFNPDLVMLDMEMPIMNGFEAARTIKNEFKHVPVVAITASVLEGKHVECIEAGCSEVVRKPFRQSELYEMLSRYLGECSYEKRAPLGQKASESPDKIDDEIAKLRKNYIAGLEERISLMRSAFEQNDFAALMAMSHKLAGAGLFGLENIGNLASTLENVVAQELASGHEIIDGYLCQIEKLAGSLITPQSVQVHSGGEKPEELAPRVLLAEDNALNRKLIKKILERAGYSVVEAEHGQEVLDHFDSGGDFQMLLLDLEMPVMNGYEVLRSLREKRQELNIPIAVLTAHVLAEVREDLVNSEIQGFLTKPIDRELLLSTVKEIVSGTCP